MMEYITPPESALALVAIFAVLAAFFGLAVLFWVLVERMRCDGRTLSQVTASMPHRLYLYPKRFNNAFEMSAKFCYPAYVYAATQRVKDRHVVKRILLS